MFCIRGLAPISAIFLLLAASSVGFSADDANWRTTPAVAILVSPKPTEVERYAADELARYLDKLFHIQVRPTSAVPKSARTILLVGNPRSNPAVATALVKGGWPRVGEQGIVLKAGRLEGRPALVIGGGSPAATLWAVYELVERWGVRFLLHGDVLPERVGPFRLPEADVVLEPNLKVRQWRAIDCLACGPECWGLADYRRVIDQLAKLRFNRIFAEIYTYSPYIDLEVKGIRRKSAALWFNWHYPISDDMPGRFLFGKAEEFWNPDLPRGGNYAEMAAAARRLLQGIFEHAQRRGMKCALGATLTEFPVEFAPLLHDSEEVVLAGAKSVVPGAKTLPDDPAVAELASATLRSILEAYPQVDYLLLGMPEHRQWVDHYKEAWQTLDRRYRLSEAASLEQILAAAAKRTGYPGGAQRAVREVKGDIVALYFYDRLLTDVKALEHTRRPDVKIVLNCAAEELFPVLPKLLRPGSETMNFVDYTPARIVKRLDALGRIPGRQMPATLIYTLHDDNVGLVPQLTTGSLHIITQELRRDGWAGFSTRYWLIGDHDLCVAYLARTAWDATATPESVYRDEIEALCGASCVADMLILFRELEAATYTLEWYGLGFSFPAPGMIMHQWQPQPLGNELASVRGQYEHALEAAHRARLRSSPLGQKYLDYWIGRLKFGIGYFDTVQLVRKAARAAAAGNGIEVRERTQAALFEARTALEYYAHVARDQSDRGAIAVMDEYVYRALKTKVSELLGDGGQSQPETSLRPSITVVKNGESAVRPENCRATLIGPGVNQPDPFPGYGGFVGWNSPVRLKNGDWLIGFSAGYWHASPPTPLRYSPKTLERYRQIGLPTDVVAPTGGRAMIIRSTDAGKTWSKPATLIDTPVDDRHPAFIEMKDGTLLCSLFMYTGTEEGEFARHPEEANHTVIVRSFDHGKTWDKAFIKPASPLLDDESDGPLVLRKDGSVLMTIDGPPKGGGKSQVALLTTRDRGETWQLLSTIKSDHDMYEATTAELPDGRLVMMARPEGDISWSPDGGHTWTKPVTFGMRLFAPSLSVLRDGTLVCLHGSYAPGHGGLRLIFSTDGGHTWIAPAKDHGFLVDGCYGYGKAMELPDGSLFVTYQDAGGHSTRDAMHMSLRCLRVRIRPDHSGIDLLPAPNK